MRETQATIGQCIHNKTVGDILADNLQHCLEVRQEGSEFSWSLYSFDHPFLDENYCVGRSTAEGAYESIHTPCLDPNPLAEGQTSTIEEAWNAVFAAYIKRKGQSEQTRTR